MTTASIRHRWMDTGLLLGVALLVFVADRLTKAWIVANIDVGAQVNVLGDFLQIWHTENAGAAFGLLQGGGILFVVIGVVTLVAIGWVHVTGRIPGAVPAVLMGLVLGGTLGNLTDRLAGGTVTDFVSVGIGERPMGDVQRRRRRGRDRHPGPRGRTLGAGPPGRRPRRMIESGERILEGPASAGRVDLAVAAMAGISRAHAQRLLSDGRATVDGGPAPGERPAGGRRTTHRDPLRARGSDPRPGVHPVAGRLRGRGPAGRRQAGGDGRPPICRASDRHPGPRPAWVGPSKRGESLGSIAGVGRPGIVHRLDRDTSGLLVVAKSDAAQASLMRQFEAREVEKEYVALVRGPAPAARGRIEAPVGRDPHDRQRMAVVAGGRSAVTDYEVIGSQGPHTLLRLRPHTGRTHQLRAHLSYLKLPIVGDLRYGGGAGPGELRRQFLHAVRLTFRRPSDGARVDSLE